MIPEDMKRNKQGGRPANHSLLLTEQEYTWLYSQMSKRVAKASEAKSKKTGLAIDALYDKMVIPVAATSPLTGYVLKVSRDELQVINTIVGNTVAGLRDRVIPEYAARAADSPRRMEAMELLVLLVELEAKGRRIYEAGSHRRGNSRV